MRRALTTVAVVLLVLGSLAPAVTAAPPSASVSTTVGPERLTDAPVSSTVATDTSAPNNTTDAPPDPESDRLGWEDGYWHNESLDVNQEDGLSQAELNATVARAMARVERIRGLEFEQTVPVEIISREEFANASSGGGEVNETFRAFDDTKFEALLLVGEEDDSLDVQQQNRGSSVLGYYSPSQDRIVIVSENASSPKIDEFTLAHELVHALQDQHFDLASIRAQTRDESNANAGIVEGDANFVEQRYDRRCGGGGTWNGSCIRPLSDGGSGGGGSGPANLGVYFLKFQPYSDGPAFVADQYRAGGWEAVNAVYGNLPASAEQVIHPEKYGEDAPTDVRLEDSHSGEWERLRPPNRLDYATVGQAGVASMFVYPLYHEGRSGGRIVQPQSWLNYTEDGSVSSFDPLNYGFDYAAGWDGDRMHFYRNADGETAYVWRLVWDSPEEATEFRDGYVQVLQYWGAQQVSDRTYRIPEGESDFADAFHVRVSGDTVTIVNAPTVDGLAQVRGSVTVQTETATTPDTSTDTSASETTTETDAPGFSATTALVALLATVLLVRRR